MVLKVGYKEKKIWKNLNKNKTKKKYKKRNIIKE